MAHGQRTGLPSPSRLAYALLAMAIALIAAACAGDSGLDAGPSGATGSGFGPGISVAEALASDLEGPLLVNGWLWHPDGGDIRLCTRLTDSPPPQCVAPSLVVVGADLSQMKGLNTAQGVTWSPQPIQLLGTMRDGTLVVSGKSKG